MSFSEVITCRTIFILCVSVLGLSTGFWHHINKEQTEKYEKVSVEFEGKPVEQETVETVAEGIRAPRYEQGILRSLVLAEKATWVKGEDVKLIKPTIYEFGQDGRTVTCLVRGDYGFMTINEATRVLTSIRMYGNVSLKRNGLKQPKTD